MKKVLIVEDDRILLKRLERTLVEYADKIEFTIARDGQEAISILEQEPVDLVVTDIEMPRMNGLILLAYIHTYYPTIPCIIITSYDTSRMKAKLPRRVLRFFHKPFQTKDLSRSIVAALDRKDPYRTLEGLTVVSFLNMIEMESISCEFEVNAPDKPRGVLYFENGVLLDAECGDLWGEAAALGIIKREISTHRFEDLPEQEVPRRIKADLQDLIRNAVIDDPEMELPLF